MKITSGKYRNRVVPTIKKADYRPTTSKIRGAMFSILNSGEFWESRLLASANLLDLFAGTGVLSFEALSRGAKSATLLDINPQYLDQAKKFAQKIGSDSDIQCRVADLKLLGASDQQYNLVFMDPPYYQNLCSQTLTKLINFHWLSSKAIIVIEMEKKTKLDLDNFLELELIKEKIYGHSKLIILRYKK